MQYISNHLYIFLSIVLAVSSQLIIKWKMTAFSFDDYETIYDKFIFAFSMLLNPYIILALTFTLLSGLSWMIAMTKFDISYAYPFTTLGFILIFIFSVIFFNEIITWQKILGLSFIILGLIISSKGV
jgi:multidrug transporter EmrE-like cation transporter